MNRKTLIIILAVVIVALLGLGFYFYSKAPSTTTTPGGIFPGGSDSVTPSAGGGGEEETNISFIPGSGQTLPRLYRLHDTPVSGIASFEVGKGADRTISARYIERALGHIYETSLSTYRESRIANETRSKISEALWGKNGQSVVIRSLDVSGNGVIKTSILNLSVATTTNPETGSSATTEEVLLPNKIPFMATAGDGSDTLFYLQSDGVTTVGTTATFKNTKSVSSFTSSFSEWLPQFPNQKLVTLTTRPSGNVLGYSFFVDPTTKAITRILAGINGLTTLTRKDGKAVLYSESKDNLYALSSYDTIKKESRPLFLNTFAEKCVWGIKDPSVVYCAVPKTMPKNLYPDRWYQGVVSFSDDIWKVNTVTTEITKVLGPEALGAPDLDITNLAITSGDEYLLFMDKNTGKPWVYRLLEEAPPVVITETTTPAAPLSAETSQSTSSPSLTEGMTKIR